MRRSIGILAFGSLINDPGAEIEASIVGRKLNIRTPFNVEFARSSMGRGGAPTLVPVRRGGSPVSGQILLLNVSEKEAKDRLWRRELNKVGKGGNYIHRDRPGPNTLIIERYEILKAWMLCWQPVLLLQLNHSRRSTLQSLRLKVRV